MSLLLLQRIYSGILSKVEMTVRQKDGCLLGGVFSIAGLYHAIEAFLGPLPLRHEPMLPACQSLTRASCCWPFAPPKSIDHQGLADLISRPEMH
jgi:hypothetical protein